MTAATSAWVRPQRTLSLPLRPQLVAVVSDVRDLRLTPHGALRSIVAHCADANVRALGIGELRQLANVLEGASR